MLNATRPTSPRIKVMLLVVDAIGIATMWEALCADVGVALLAILNAVRIQKMEFVTFKKRP